MSLVYLNGKGRDMIDSYKEPSGSIPIRSIQWDSSWPELAEEDDSHLLLSYLEDRFGIPHGLFEGFLLFKKKRSWWLVKRSPWIAWASRLKVSMVGLRAFQKTGKFVKPTTRLIQIFGDRATRAKFDIDEEQLKKLLKGALLSVDLELENGYVILTFQGRPLGLGLLIDGMIRSQIPHMEFLIDNKGF